MVSAVQLRICADLQCCNLRELVYMLPTAFYAVVLLHIMVCIEQ